MKKFNAITLLLLALWMTGCGEGVGITTVGNPSGTSAPLTTLASLPELDVGRYDTSASTYSSPSALKVQGLVSSSERFSRAGCDAKSYKKDMIELSLFAEEFLCLYKMAEKHYPSQFSIPTNGFNYYTIESGEDTLLGRIGYYPEGFGAITEPVLVLDECNTGTHVAEMRVTASNINEEITGSGYYIQLTETDYLGNQALDESLSFTIDTRESVWETSVTFHRPLEGSERVWYGTLGLALDLENNFNIFTTATYDEDISGIYEITSNTVFGPWTELEGFEVGGSSHVNVIQSGNPDAVEIGQITGFVFNDSVTFPAIQLDATEITEFPYYVELAALDSPPISVTEPDITFSEEWDCEIPAGGQAVTIDLTPETIAEELLACEGEDTEEDDLNCAEIEDELP